jgi:hypothetical protein
VSLAIAQQRLAAARRIGSRRLNLSNHLTALPFGYAGAILAAVVRSGKENAENGRA